MPLPPRRGCRRRCTACTLTMLSPVQVPCLVHSCSQKESYFLPASSSGTCRVRVRTKIPVARFRIGQES